MATEHFTDKELECHCECGTLPSADFQYYLQQLRYEYGKPMRVNSCARCPDHNERVSPKTGRTGPHTIGAVDIAIWGGDAVRLRYDAYCLGWTGFGEQQKGPYASRFLHLDRLPDAPGQPRPWIWTYP